MSKEYEKGLTALQDLLPPLEDCPNCGTSKVKTTSSPVKTRDPSLKERTN